MAARVLVHVSPTDCIPHVPAAAAAAAGVGAIEGDHEDLHCSAVCGFAGCPVIMPSLGH